MINALAAMSVDTCAGLPRSPQIANSGSQSFIESWSCDIYQAALLSLLFLQVRLDVWLLMSMSHQPGRNVQVFSACVMSFAHGANDVANAMGPFAAIYSIWQTSTVPSKSHVPEWILVVGECQPPGIWKRKG